GSFAAFWLHNNKGRLTRGCNPAYSKSIHTWLRFGEIMRGSLSTQWVIDSMRVKTPGHRTQIGSLSGGNQQKVIIGRWLLTQPEILMLDEPTRGIDVGAKFEIYQLIAELAKKGKGIIIISSEMPELLGITDRILVMSNGLVSGIVDTKTTTQNEILRLASLHL
ncbi:ATP-binding cassette domain-containing protein, partial [Escherichia coli]